MAYSLVGTLIPIPASGANLRIEAWDAAGLCPDLIDVAASDARGRFEMILDPDYLAALLPEKVPQIAFRIFNSGKAVAQAKQIVWAVNTQTAQLQIPLAAAANPTTALVPAQAVVRGTVFNADGSSAPNRTVQAFDSNLAATGFAQVQLGQATTAADGSYEIHYVMPPNGKLKPDLIVRVEAIAPPSTNVPARPPAASSALISNAPTVAMVDLGLDDAVAALPSEYRALATLAQPVAGRAKLGLADLTDEQIVFVAGSTGIQPDRMTTMAQAAQLARDAGGGIDAEIFYGLLRSGHEGDLAALASVPVDVQRPRLELAIERNLISATYEPQIDTILTQLQNAVAARAMPATGASSVSTALANALASRDVQTAFVARWIGRTRSVQQFWNDVRTDAALGPSAGDLETTLRLDMLFGGFQPALAELKARRQAGSIKSLRDLARWRDGDWQAFLTATGTPASVPGDTQAAKVAAWAAKLQLSVRTAFPTEYLRGRAAVAPPPLPTKFVPILAAANPALDLTRPLPDAPNWGTIAVADQPAARAEWAQFQREARTFGAVPARALLASVVQASGVNPIRSAANQVLAASTADFELTTVDQYLTANPKALDGVDAGARPAVIGYLKGVQRIVRLAGKPEAVEQLLADGLDSAMRIARIPRAEFVDRYTTLFGGDATAHDVFSAAFRSAATAQLALTTVAQSMTDISPWAIRGGSTAKFSPPDFGAVLSLMKNAAGATDGAASWPTLFQGEAWCDCDDCQSIYGPAAYFVDLLHMLDPDGSDDAPVDHLFARRPDLPNLLLTCDNTNTALPYIDVVNEILELHIAANNGYVNPATGQPYATSTSYDSTGLSAAELRAVPQNLIGDVYDKALTEAVFPFTLPFRRALAVMRSYLDELGTSYYDVLDAFGPGTGSDGLSAAERLAAETLGLTIRQFKLIAGMPVPDDQPLALPAFYGYDAQDPNWQAKLAAVPELLLRTGIAYDDLYALIGDQTQSGTYFLNRDGAVALDPPVACQIDGTSLHAAADTWDRLHRFIRLWRATSWSIADLDRVLFAIGAQADHSVTLDRDALRRVALVESTLDALDQPLAAVLALWSDLDSWGTDSLYLSLFQNRNVARLDDAAAFRLAGDPTAKPATGAGELATATEPMSSHVATILAALRIAAADLEAIWDHALEVAAFGAAVTTRDQTLLNLHNLTVVYRYTVLAKGLSLRIADLVELLRLTGANPFTANDPAPTLAFIDQVTAVGASGCSVATLAYLYRCYAAPGQGPAPADSVVSDALAKIWTALRGVRQDTAIAEDPDGTLLASRLALVQPPEIVRAILDALDPSKGLSAAARKQALDDGLEPILGAGLADAETQVLGTPDPDPNDAIALAARKLANQTAVLVSVSAALRISFSQSAAVSVVAGTLGLTDSMARALLTDWIPGDGGTALDTLLDLAGGGLNRQLFDGAGYTNPEQGTEIADSVALQTTMGTAPRGAVWTGYLLPLGDGDHSFVLRTDGACSIAIGDAPEISFPAQLDGTRPLIVDNAPPPVTLTADRLVKIVVRYDSGSAPGTFALLWKLAGASTATPVAPEYMFPTLTALVEDGKGPGFAWKRAHKASLLILGLGLTEEEIAYAESGDQPFGAFHLRDLPMQAPAPDAIHAAMARWQELAAFIRVRASLPVSDTTLAGVLESRTPANTPDPLGWWTESLCAAAGWDPDAVQPLLTPVPDWTASGATVVAGLLAGVAGALPAGGPFELGRRLAALQRCLDLVKRIGVSGDAPAGTRPTLRLWAAAEPDSVAAGEAVQAVRARYTDDTQWYQVAQTRNDTLRQQQRDALVAHIMPRITIDGAPPKDVNALYEHFLIDVEMCACGQTSRVLQGISTVQLFIQRILLGLEKPISPSRIDPDKWEWNQEYRVWQANREIFLYPENWIDPELRVDKTPFFADLQSQLSQGPLDSDNVEEAFEDYLLKLDQVSRLKICALHWQREGKLTDADSEISNAAIIDTLHVVARTPGAHPVYFYRTLLGTASGNGGTEWTPWQKIDVDIQSDGDAGDVHILLVTYDRRLYLFWALFSEVPEPSQPGATEGDSPSPPLTHWEIRLAWSTCRNGVWSAKQVSSQSIVSNRFITEGESGAYKDAIHEYKHRLNQANSIYRKAAQKVTAAENDLWTELGNGSSGMRHALIQSIAAVVGSDVNDIYSVLSTLFFFLLNNVEDLEAWLNGQHTTFPSWIDGIYKQVAQWHQDDGNVPLIATPAAASLKKDYDRILDLRKTRDDLLDEYEKLKKALADFNGGMSALAVPGYTKRSDHTFWISTADGVDIDVARHDDKSSPRQIGTFSLSEDGRSLSAKSVGSGRYNLSRQTPRHSDPDINAFRVDVSGGKGLDLEGMPNLLGRVHDADFFDEHWWHHPATSDNPRPFFVAKGSDVEVALPFAAQTVDEPAVSPIFEQGGVAISGNYVLPGINPVQNAPPGGPQQQTRASDALQVSANEPMVEDAAEIIQDGKSFGLNMFAPNTLPTVTVQPLYCFEPAHHPFVRSLIKRLERDGVDGLLKTRAQNPSGSDHGEHGAYFDSTYDPSAAFVSYPYSPHDVDFRPQGPYAPYNWELFFHVPYLIAARLMQDARYDDARRWLHYIFDPTASSKEDAPTRFWKLQPFRDNTDTLNAAQLMTALATNAPPDVAASVKAEIDQWNRYPADPHRIARLRLSAYQKAIVFKYLDNLIAWADSLFTQNTIETINQATQLYVFASDLLGPRPEHVPQKSDIQPFTYSQVRGQLDQMSDMVAEVECMIYPAPQSKSMNPPQPVAHALLGIGHLGLIWPSAATPDVPTVPLAFCVPPNSKLLSYFDTIDDRLFKIRHCMNIEGVVQQLPLFQPPIDPALLVRAAAMGLDIGSILADLSAPLPFHRFSTMLGRALELCADLKSLGGQLLSALEKQDAEALALLRAANDSALLKAVLDIKKQQVKEAETNKDALQKSRDVAQAKYAYYASRAFMNVWEDLQIQGMLIGGGMRLTGSLMSMAASAAANVPDFEVGPTGMGVHGTAKYGGSTVANIAGYLGESLALSGEAAQTGAGASGILGGHYRRQDEWDFQKDLAIGELAQIDKQLAAADIRIAVANLDVSNQQLQIDNAAKIEDTLRTKYTNAELYSWMVTQISTTYYQAYKLAYDLAKRAERCYRYELGVASSNFIQFGYWDSLRKGLNAGEQLALDLKRMDASYLQTNRREYEITRQVSLVLYDPQAFVNLRQQGWCEVDLPEELFDADYPGHYFRRLKTVSLTVPCVAGPYTPINCRLTLLSSRIRTSALAGAKYPEQNAPNDARFSHDYAAIQSVATSHGQNDSGLFEVNFRDERYLPFEGAGAVSHWRIDLPRDCNAFDFDTLSDVVMRVSYTARDGGKPLADAARKSLRARWATTDQEDGVAPTTPLRRLFRVRFEFSDAWMQFRNALSSGDAAMTLTIDRDRFPYQFRGVPVTMMNVQLLAMLSSTVPQNSVTVTVAPPQGQARDLVLVAAPDPTVLVSPLFDLSPGIDLGSNVSWVISAKAGFPIANVRDFAILLTYTVKLPT